MPGDEKGTGCAGVSVPLAALPGCLDSIVKEQEEEEGTQRRRKRPHFLSSQCLLGVAHG